MCPDLKGLRNIKLSENERKKKTEREKERKRKIERESGRERKRERDR